MGESTAAVAAADAYGLFVSSVQGRPVNRLGAIGSSVLIGASRDPDNSKKLKYRTEEIVAIPRAEVDRYAREYARLVADGDLVVRSAGEWSDQQAKDAHADK
jgi:hypothetical protein